ncbi:MAG: DUF167 domain-containing protein [Candidatus Firestonebacteria bacterium]
MRIEVSAKPNSGRTKVEKTGENEYKVWVAKPPHENQANEAVIKALSDHLHVPKSGIKLIRGGKGRQKTFEITL